MAVLTAEQLSEPLTRLRIGYDPALVPAGGAEVIGQCASPLADAMPSNIEAAGRGFHEKILIKTGAFASREGTARSSKRFFPSILAEVAGGGVARRAEVAAVVPVGVAGGAPRPRGALRGVVGEVEGVDGDALFGHAPGVQPAEDALEHSEWFAATLRQRAAELERDVVDPAAAADVVEHVGELELAEALADEAARMRDEIVRVDVFEKVGPLEGQEGYERPALAQTAEYSARRAQEHARLAAAA